MIYTFDRVFHGDTNQLEVFEMAAKEVVEDVIKGYNGTIFAYGQTGSGKSFTMFGPDIDSSEQKGIIPRACEYIFNHIAIDSEERVYEVRCSFLEIYKEVIKDLLDPKNINLKVRETPTRGVWVEGLSDQSVQNVTEVITLLRDGEEHRSVASTNMNATSSRSHSLFILTLIQKERDGTTKIGKLNLADLAGSEKVGKTGAVGETLEEAKKINQSLSALGNCIMALTKAKKGHVPYRDSKLTFILRESLGGNAKTTLLIACSPHSFNLEETVSTLRFGQRAKTIKNKAKINQQRSIEELELIVKKLTRELQLVKRYARRLEDELKTSKGEDFDIETLRKSIYDEIKRTSDIVLPKEEPKKVETPTKQLVFTEDMTTPTRSTSDKPNNDRTTPRSLSKTLLSLMDDDIPESPRHDTSSNEDEEYISFLDHELEMTRFKESVSIKIQDLNDEIVSLKEELEKMNRDHAIEVTTLNNKLKKAYKEKNQQGKSNGNTESGKGDGQPKEETFTKAPPPRRRNSLASIVPPGLIEQQKDGMLMTQHIYDWMLLAIKLENFIQGNVFSAEFDKQKLYEKLIKENVAIQHWPQQIIRELVPLKGKGRRI